MWFRTVDLCWVVIYHIPYDIPYPKPELVWNVFSDTISAWFSYSDQKLKFRSDQHDLVLHQLHYITVQVIHSLCGAQISQSRSLSHNLIYIMEGFIVERSSALFEKEGSDRIPYITSLMYSMCNISTSHNKVKGDRLELPEWPCALLLASVVVMYAKPSWKQRLYSLCYYTNVGLQGRRVTLRAHQCSCLLLKLLSEKHLFLIKGGGEAPAGRVITPPSL